VFTTKKVIGSNIPTLNQEVKHGRS